MERVAVNSIYRSVEAGPVRQGHRCSKFSQAVARWLPRLVHAILFLMGHIMAAKELIGRR
jgi:hypothetical protein